MVEGQGVHVEEHQLQGNVAAQDALLHAQAPPSQSCYRPMNASGRAGVHSNHALLSGVLSKAVSKG